jgi:hypothetical protein
MDPLPTQKRRLHELFPAITRSPSPCRLLDLPRELRDEIYRYALTYGEGVRVTKKMKLYSAKLKLGAKGQGGVTPVEANAIEYTCHQIYAETRGLTMRFNDTFTLKGCHGDDYGFWKFLEFAWKMGTTRCAPKRIDIYPDLTNETHHITAQDIHHRLLLFYDHLYDDLKVVFAAPQQTLLQGFCMKHPDTTVFLHLKAPSALYNSLFTTYYMLDRRMRRLRALELETPVPENLRVVLEIKDGDEYGSGSVVGCRGCSNVVYHRERADFLGHCPDDTEDFVSKTCQLCIGCDCKARTAALIEQHKGGL